MNDYLHNNKLVGNLVLAFIFGGGLLLLTLFAFDLNDPKIWMGISFSVIATIVLFIAGSAHDRAAGPPKRSTPSKISPPQRQRRRQPQPQHVPAFNTDEAE